MHMAQNAFARCAEKVNTRKNLTLNRQAVGEVVSYCTMIAANDTLDFNRDKQERLCTEMNHRAEVYTVEMSAYGQPKAREKLRERTAPILISWGGDDVARDSGAGLLLDVPPVTGGNLVYFLVKCCHGVGSFWF